MSASNEHTVRGAQDQPTLLPNDAEPLMAPDWRRDDTELVRACRAAGGFPRIDLDNGRPDLVDADGKPWRGGGR